ncbi:MAG: RNA polymerase sigma factor [Firmicutes bacterium]|nr:RNA polymerase sigma factor [[Eubacterium] siraeum]MCM1489134.1 RNA polymerase sigma factor [Bacillota bacterium]
MTDKELQFKLSEMAKGDTKAFEEIYTDLKAPIMTVILRITGSREKAEDIFQDTFVKVFKNPPSENLEKPKAYIYKIAVNLAVDGLRKEKPEAPLEDFEEILSYKETDHGLKIDIENALNKLPLNQRQAVTLHINGGLTFREIGEIIGAPTGTVIWRYQKAISRLKSILSE